MARLKVSACIVAALLLGGCAATAPQVDREAVQAYLIDKPAETHNLYTRVVTEGERSRVLNLLRAGLGAMELGHDDLAARSFDEALLTIETIYGGDASAARARGTFTAEERKTFRGEPYERAMAFYYRGILYLMEGDYENARASFRSGILQDTLAEQEAFRQDFALLEFLEGWSSQCNGNAALAADAYALAKTHNPGAVLPEADHDLLVLADLGHAPVKYADGGHGELLRIKGSSQRGSTSAQVSLSDGTEALRNTESILWQAQTRGGRQFDAILEGKVRFKEGAEELAEVAGTVAQVGVATGMAGLVSGNTDLARVGAGAAIIGGAISLLSSSAAKATKPQADTRQWDNLPEAVAYGTFRADGASADGVRIEFDGEPSAGSPRYGGDASCKVAWARSHSANAASPLWAQVAGKTFTGTYNSEHHGEFDYAITFTPEGVAYNKIKGRGLGAITGALFAGGRPEEGIWRTEGESITTEFIRDPPGITHTNISNLQMRGESLMGTASVRTETPFETRISYDTVHVRWDRNATPLGE